MFSFDMFKNSKATQSTKKPEEDIIATSDSPEEFDISKINPVGNGEKVDAIVIGTGPGGYLLQNN